MTNLHDARVEAAARALFHDPLASDDYTWEEMVAEDNSRAELWRDDARRVLAAADAVTATPPGKRLKREFRASLVDIAAGSIQSVWDDVPEGVDATTLAQNVVGAQEFAWIAAGFPIEAADAVVTVEPARVQLAAQRKIGKTARMVDMILDQSNERGVVVEVVYPAPTVEMIAAALRTVTDVHHPDQCDCTEDEVCDGAWDEARAVLALIRGGGEQC